jgi:hypothetical protein
MRRSCVGSRDGCIATNHTYCRDSSFDPSQSARSPLEALGSRFGLAFQFGTAPQDSTLSRDVTLKQLLAKPDGKPCPPNNTSGKDHICKYLQHHHYPTPGAALRDLRRAVYEERFFHGVSPRLRSPTHPCVVMCIAAGRREHRIASVEWGRRE